MAEKLYHSLTADWLQPGNLALPVPNADIARAVELRFSFAPDGPLPETDADGFYFRIVGGSEEAQEVNYLGFLDVSTLMREGRSDEIPTVVVLDPLFTRSLTVHLRNYTAVQWWALAEARLII